jgi:nucleotide-binding universal stress UspA family protein
MSIGQPVQRCDGDKYDREVVAVEPIGRVVVGVGRSLGAYQALRYAVGEARRRGVTLVAVRTFHLANGEEGLLNAALLTSAAAEQVRAAFTEAIGQFPPDVESEIVVLVGPAGSALVSVANRESDLLIIGGCGARRWGRLRTAATARFCARHSVCPVVIVPPTALARSGQADRLARHTARDIEDYLERQRP